MPRRRFPGNRRNRNNPENRDGRPENRDSRGGFSEYMEEAAEDLRDEREERRASRDAYYKEEAADRRLDRGIRGDRYYEVEREELLDQRDDRQQRRDVAREELLDYRDDRRQEREIGDRVRLQRTAFLGGAFASEEDRAFRKIMQREVREEKLAQYHQLTQQCQDRIREYHTMGDWLEDIKRSDFDTATIDKVRTEAREQKLQLLTRRSQSELLTERSNWSADERKVLQRLTNLTAQEEKIYDDVLAACDTAALENVDSALKDVRYCVGQAEDALKMIPQLAAGQKRSYDHADSMQSILRYAATGVKCSACVAPLMFIGACIAGDGFAVGQGFAAAFLTVIIGSVGGGGFGYYKSRAEGKDDLDFSL